MCLYSKKYFYSCFNYVIREIELWSIKGKLYLSRAGMHIKVELAHRDRQCISSMWFELKKRRVLPALDGSRHPVLLH
jgi:hypothetical protein